MDKITKLEGCLQLIQENQSFSLWLFSTLFEYLDEVGFKAPDPDVYAKLSDCFCHSMVNQSTISHYLSAFFVATRRDHIMQDLPSSVSNTQRHRLAASSPFNEVLFDPDTLARVTEEYKGDMNLGAQVALTTLAKGPQGGTKRKRPQQQTPRNSLLTPASTQGGKSPLVPHKGDSKPRIQFLKGNFSKGRGRGRGKSQFQNPNSNERGFRR